MATNAVMCLRQVLESQIVYLCGITQGTSPASLAMQAFFFFAPLVYPISHEFCLGWMKGDAWRWCVISLPVLIITFIQLTVSLSSPLKPFY
jgi:hypothetical protein